MSDKSIARRTKVEVTFGGVDISESIKPYFKSLTFTDNEEDDPDDLSIQLIDRDDLLLTQWLNDIVDAAATGAAASTVSAYKVTAQSGLNVRSGPGTNHAKLGALAYGTQINISSIEDGWAAIIYSGKPAFVSASYITPVSNSSAGASSDVIGLKIQAVIIAENWLSDGKDKALNCGQFELDAIDAGGPPSIVDIKATALPYSAQIRQTKKSRAWESYTLSGIAKEVAAKNGMTCLYESATDPYYERVEQVKTTDIKLLSKLCHDAGVSLKVTNNILVLFDQAAYEAKPSVLTVKRGDGSYIKWKLHTGEADTKYASCRVSYTDPASGKSIEATAYVDDYDAKKEDSQQLEITAKVSSIAEAKALAKKSLRLHNKYQKTASLTLPGNPGLLAGLTVELTGWGMWSGKHIIKKAVHSVGSGGYTTQIELRRVLEGY